MADTAVVLTGGSNNYATTSEDLNALQTDILSEGVVGAIGNTAGVAPATGALACNAQGTPDMTVAVTAGKAYVTVTPTSQGSQLLRANIAAQNATIAANSTGGTRYDWIYVSMSASGAANPAVDGTGVASISVSRSTSSTTDNGTPPTYGYNIAVVTVTNGAASITNGNIRDTRALVALSTTGGTDGWITAEAVPNTITALGNRSYTAVINSLDMTDTISNGMRVKLSRTVTAPTQCTDLEASSSQYYSRATGSLTGISFTDDFAVSAWVKLESYGVGTVISRYNGTSGWSLRVGALGSADGRVQLTGFNAGAANYSTVYSAQSIPLNKWVHIAAQLDMSAFTNTTTTSYVMIDGVNAPASVTRGGTNPTALVQAGDLQIGASNTTEFFDGKIAQVALYNAKVTQATMLAAMHQTLSGSETSLVSAYSFNNSITDLNSSNANNLTANAGAVATNADSPFAGGSVGSTEYGIVTGSSFSTNTTLTVQVPEGYALPTSGGISSMSYSTQGVPYGFPADKERWSVATVIRTLQTVSILAVNTYYPALPSLTVPVGRWKIGWQGCIYQASTAGGLRDPYYAMETSTPGGTVRDGALTVRGYLNIGASIALGVFYRTTDLNASSAQTYFMYGSISAATGTETYNIDGLSGGLFTMFAECVYL